MQAADIAIGLRRRSPWEAMDLGLTMLQRWWRAVYVPHLLFAVPLMAAAIAVGWWFERAWLGLLIVWWLKPVYDRLVLHVLSRAVFGEQRSVGGASALSHSGQRAGPCSVTVSAPCRTATVPSTTRIFPTRASQSAGA